MGKMNKNDTGILEYKKARACGAQIAEGQFGVVYSSKD